ncbi:MAG: gamma-glutamyl-gamma-aminobutyrate hydrolase family protein [Gammaproteobacteria bacterium]
MTGPRRGAWGPRICVHLALLASGGRPVHLRPGDSVDAMALDGLVITGGHDVEPVLYKAAAEIEGNYDPERDAFEAGIIDQALQHRIPLLGICRGAQLLNVQLGGSLIQDLRKHRKLTSNRRTLLPLKTLCLEQGSRLAELLGKDTLKINSLHKQSIDHIGSGLRVSGRDLDDIVQAVEYPERDYLFGVQWHPEFLAYLPRQRRLFRDLVSAACAHAERRARDI